MKKAASMGRNILIYTSSSAFKHVLGLVTAFVKPRFLSPEMFGLLNLFNVIPTYSEYSNLGTYDIARYRIPQLEGRGEGDRSLDVQKTVFLGSLVATALICTGLLVAAAAGNFSLTVRGCLVIVAVSVLFQWYHNNYVVVLKARQEFVLLSSSIVLKAFFTLLMTALLIYTLGLYGALLAPIVTLVPILLYLRRRYPLDRTGSFSWTLYLQLTREGLPIMAYNFAAVLLNTTDRIVISAFLGYESLGHYGIAILAFSFLRQIPGTAREVIEPSLMQSISHSSREETLREFLFKPLVTTAFLMPLMVGPAVFLVPAAVTLLLPRYVLGIPAAQLVLYGGYFLALAYIIRGTIVAHSWQVTGALIMAGAVLLNVGLSIAAVKLGLGIGGVAASSAFSQFALLCACLAYLRRKCPYADRDWRETLIATACPFLVMTLSIVGLRLLFAVLPLNLYAAAAIETALFLGIMLALTMICRGKISYLQGFTLRSLRGRRN